jgi:hypothetical protein
MDTTSSSSLLTTASTTNGKTANKQSVFLVALPSSEPEVADLSRYVGSGMLYHCFASPERGVLASEVEFRKSIHSLLEQRAAVSSRAGRGRIGVLVLAVISDFSGGDWEGELRTSDEGLQSQLVEAVRDDIGADVDVKIGVVAVRDLVETLPGDAGSDGMTTRAGTGTGLVLVVKIAGAVARMGYTFEDVQKVANLVGENVWSVKMTLTAENVGVEEVNVSKGQVREVLARLLKPAHHEDEVVALRVNSNEPVLLVNTWESATKREVAALCLQTVTQLHKDYGIRPVRVYAGEYMAGTHRSEKTFCISILNVVNTEIGGPSMVQLLDAPSEARGWSTSVTKEEWEQSDGSVDRTLELGMKNWTTATEKSDRDDATDVENSRNELESRGLELGNGSDAETDSDVLLSRAEKEYVTVGKSTDLAVPNIPTSEEHEDDNPPEMDTVEERTQDKSNEQKFQEGEETNTETKNLDEPGDVEEKVIETEGKDATARETGDVQEPENKHVGVTNVDEPKPSSEEDFEIVDRERTLIDMVFGHGKR